jgi:hypothetical protein
MTRAGKKLVSAATGAVLTLAAVTPALGEGGFGQWRAPDANSVTSPNGDSSIYNPHVDGTAGSGKNTYSEGDAISSRTGLENATQTTQDINSSGQASPQGTPGGGR